jgi:hypothetical protein
MTNARHWQLEVAATTAKEAATKMLYCHVLEIQCSPCHSLRRTSGNTVGRWCATKLPSSFERLRGQPMQQLTALALTLTDTGTDAGAER